MNTFSYLFCISLPSKVKKKWTVIDKDILINIWHLFESFNSMRGSQLHSIPFFLLPQKTMNVRQTFGTRAH